MSHCALYGSIHLSTYWFMLFCLFVICLYMKMEATIATIMILYTILAIISAVNITHRWNLDGLSGNWVHSQSTENEPNWLSFLSATSSSGFRFNLSHTLTSMKQICLKFCSHIYVSFRTYHNNISDPLSFHLTPLAGQYFSWSNTLCKTNDLPISLSCHFCFVLISKWKHASMVN